MSKLSTSLQAGQAKGLNKVDNGANTNMRASATTYTLARAGIGNYRANFGMDLNSCTWSAAPSADGLVQTAFSVKTALDPGNNQQIAVGTYTDTGALTDSGFNIQVYC